MKKTLSDEIKKLTPYQHVRLRTETYFGSRNPHTQTVVNWTGKKLEPVEMTWTPAVYCAFREILDNSLDEVVVRGFGDTIDITYNPKTFEFSVADNGRGIPIDWDENERMHKATLAMSHLMTGRNFEERGESGGMNGIGASGVNFCSEYFDVIIQRDNTRFEQLFREGSEMFDELDVRAPKLSKGGAKSGTYIRFKLSNTVFKRIKLPIDFVTARIFELAASYPKLKFNFNGKRLVVKPTIEKTIFSDRDVIIIDINDAKFKSKYYLVPEFATEGEYVYSTVNRIPAFNGGEHIDTFKRLFYSGLIKSLDRENRRRGLIPNKSDIAEGLLIYNITYMEDPSFDGQTKSRLVNDNINVYIKTVLDDEETFKIIIKQNKEWIDKIYQRCSDRTQKKDDAEVAKQGRKLLRTKVPKLLDANGKDRTKCILLITEGDCIAEQTLVKTVIDGKLIDTKAKDVKVGDIVLSHRNKLQFVTNTSKKVTKSIVIQTSVGEILVGENHRLLTYNKKYQNFDYTLAKDLDISTHQLVKNRYSDMSFMHLIYHIDIDIDNILPVKILYGDETNLYVIDSTIDHLFGVYNTEEMLFEKITASELKPKIHALVMG
jgi:DNA gyrase/topoisomerase IV subunit B